MTDSLAKQKLRELILQRPAQMPPQGVVANFENPPDSVYEACKGLLFLTLAVATVFVATKLYSQIWLSRKVQLEDCLFVAAWAIYCFGFTPVAMKIGELPMGIHQWNTHYGAFFDHLYWWYCDFALYNVIILLLKIVVLLQMARFFVPGGVRDFTYWAVQVNIWVTTVFYIIFVATSIFACNPRAKFWDKTILEGKCIDFLALHVAGAVICLVSDIAILLLPQKVILSLHLPTKRKIGLSLVFAVGTFACVTSAVRLYYHIDLFHNKSDYTYRLARIGIWAMAQVLAGFIVAGTPTLPKMMTALGKTRLGSRIETNVRYWFGKSLSKTSRESKQVVTIGGGGGGGNRKAGRPKMMSEFEELVVRTDGTYDSSREEEDKGPALQTA